MLSFAWFYFSSGSRVSLKHSKNGEYSCSHGLLAFISHTRLSKELFVFLPLLSSGANLALRRIANEDTGDRGKVFVCVIFVWFIVHLDFLSRKHFLRTNYLRIFLFGHLPFTNCEGRSLANDRCSVVLEYSPTGRYSTLSEQLLDIFLDFI